MDGVPMWALSWASVLRSAKRLEDARGFLKAAKEAKWSIAPTGDALTKILHSLDRIAGDVALMKTKVTQLAEQKQWEHSAR